MSWGATLKYKDGLFETVHEGNVEINEHREQYANALNLAKALIDSGAVGEGEFNVSLSGHGNPDHQKTPGWGNDFVSVQVTQV